MKNDSGVYVYPKCNENLYKFLKFWQENDGSFYTSILFNKIPKDNLKYCFNFKEVPTEVKEKNEKENVKTGKKYISYHTSGRINHDINLESIFLEPLVNIQNFNTYFMFSIPSITKLEKVDNIYNDLEKKNIIIDLTMFSDERLNFFFNIFPSEFDSYNTIQNILMILKFDNFFTFVLTFEIDTLALNLGKNVKNEAFLYGSQEKGLFEKQELSQNEAFLKFQHKLYKTDKCILFAPNNEGIFRIIFVVEMRIAPRVRIIFENENYEIRQLNVNKVKATFRIFDTKRKIYIKKEEDVKIKLIELDSEIY